MAPLAINSVSIMGVLNVTPDSFSDGGRFLCPAQALAHARQLIEDGADIIDLGAESTRPGAKPLSVEEEWERLAPVLEPLRKVLTTDFPQVLLSVDSYKPETLLRAAASGVDIINDISGGRDPRVLERLSRYPNLTYLAMHMHGTPGSMQEKPLEGPAAVAAVDRFFQETQARLLASGFGAERIWVDPGIGFGKTDSGNWQLMMQTKKWAERYNLAIGISRKSFIGRALDLKSPSDRDGPTKMLEIGLVACGARMIRTHDVARLKALLTLSGNRGTADA